MSKLRKVCAILCSGMCALGSTSANPRNESTEDIQDMVSCDSDAFGSSVEWGNKSTKDIQDMVNCDSDAFGSSVEWGNKSTKDIQDMMNCAPEAFRSWIEQFIKEENAKYQKVRKKASCYGAYTPFSFGSITGKNADSAEARGRLKILKDRGVLKCITEGDLDSLAKSTASIEALSHVISILLAIVFPGIIGFVVFKFVLWKMLERFPRSENSTTRSVAWMVLSLSVATAASCIVDGSISGVFNVLARELTGKSKEMRDVCKELAKMADKVAQEMENRKMKDRISKNGRVVEVKTDKTKLTRGKTVKFKAAEKKSSKMSNLNKALGVVPAV